MAVDKGKGIFIGFRLAGVCPRLRGVVPRKQHDRLCQHAAVAVERSRARVSAQALVAAAACRHDIESAVNITVTLLSAAQPFVGKFRCDIPQQQRTEALQRFHALDVRQIIKIAVDLGCHIVVHRRIVHIKPRPQYRRRLEIRCHSLLLRDV